MTNAEAVDWLTTTAAGEIDPRRTWRQQKVGAPALSTDAAPPAARPNSPTGRWDSARANRPVMRRISRVCRTAGLRRQGQVFAQGDANLSCHTMSGDDEQVGVDIPTVEAVGEFGPVTVRRTDGCDRDQDG